MEKMIAERYMIISNLGEGGMADVFLAVDTILKREVAIKILRGELSNDPITLLRFQREANAASKLTHPNVVDVYDVGEYNHRHYIVMEYVRGRTLKQLLSQRGALHKEEALDIMKQLVSAVKHAHDNHIVHRDIKPQNIMIKDDGTVKITDFGIAFAHDAVQLTQSDAVLGSAHYLAPETTRGESATNQVDIYALGIVFYELLSGSVPFKGDNPVQIAMMHLREEIPSICEFNPTLPQSIENIIRKATVKNKALRYQNLDKMLEDLNQCLLPAYANVEKLVFEEEEQDTMKEEEEKTLSSNIKEEKGSANKKKKVAILLVLSLFIIGIGTTVIYYTGVFPGFAHNPSLIIPNIINYEEELAKSTLEEAGFLAENIIFKRELSKTIEEGHVISVEPKEASQVKKNDKIEVTISKGLYFTIENYVGKTLEEVETLFKEKGVKIKITVEKKTMGDRPGGIIMEQSLLVEGDFIDPQEEKEIKFVVSARPEFVIPNIIGRPIKEAQKELQDKGAAVVIYQKSLNGLTSEQIEQIEKGVVVECNPMVGVTYTQEGDAYITLYYY
ncbi:MAG: Stk1 family PASTA domain-containing Ser/Thr kinase [Erysipelotrichaceae bacterium]|nr:Stk1 family PASTA domain-containing Ser/Thr kinase [Erysipelotrichaceae bacterium]